MFQLKLINKKIVYLGLFFDFLYYCLNFNYDNKEENQNYDINKHGPAKRRSS